ncbi:MAG: hypothetical protein V2A65_07535 [Candidatus Omnitrophota bacterium]
MTPKKLKIETVEKSDYRIYLKKAADFHDIMLKVFDSANWTAAGLNAVHCAISCCDALLVFHLGVRSIGEDHMQAADLLLRLPQKLTGEVATFKRIVAKKNLIAYENREFRRVEALEITKTAERFYSWAKSNLPAR